VIRSVDPDMDRCHGGKRGFWSVQIFAPAHPSFNRSASLDKKLPPEAGGRGIRARNKGPRRTTSKGREDWPLI